MFREALTDHLLADADLAELVDVRVTWFTRPQSHDLPAVVLYLIDGIPDYAMTGPTGLEASRVQANCVGVSPEEAVAVMRAVKAALSGIDVLIGDGNSPELFTRLRGGFVSELPDSNPEPEAGSVLTYESSLDFIIWHTTG